MQMLAKQPPEARIAPDSPVIGETLPRRWFLASLYLVLASCAATPMEVNRSFIPPDAKEKGVVIMSVTSTGPFGHSLPGDLRFRCDSGASGSVTSRWGDFNRYLDGERLSIPVSPSLELTSERPTGRVHVVELPAGNCAFIYFGGFATGHASTTSVESRPTMRITFSVAPNAVQYVGNFNMHWAPGRGQPSFNDFYERDLAAVRAQNAALAQNVRKTVGKVMSW